MKSSNGAPAFARGISVLLLVVAVASVLAVAFGAANHALVDADIWLHWRVGNDILAGDGIPTTNTYSHTATDFEWVDHEWLFQVLCAAAGGAEVDFDAAAAGLNLLRIGLVFLLAIVVLAGDRFDLRRCAALGLPAAVAFLLLWPRLLIRPELFSYLGFVLAVRWIDGATAGRPASPAPVTWIDRLRSPEGRTFLLTVLWAQFHGFYMLVAGLWLLAMLLHPLQRRLGGAASTKWSALWPAAAALAVCAGLLTPNHWHGLIYPFRALGQLGDGGGLDLGGGIAEMVPLLDLGPSLGTTILFFQLSLVWAGLWLVLTAGRVSLLRAAILVATSAAAFFAQRNLGFYALSFFLVHSGYRGERPLLWERFDFVAKVWRRLPAVMPAVVPAVGAAGALAVALVWLPAVADDSFYLREGVSWRSGSGLTPGLYPWKLAASVAERSSGRDIALVNNIDAASTLIATRAGKVGIDGRTEAYPAAAWRDYGTFKAGGEGALRLLARRPPAAVFIGHYTASGTGLVETLLRSPAWYPAAADECGIVFVAAGDRAAETVAALTGSTISGAITAARATAADVGGVRGADILLAAATLARIAGAPETEALFRAGFELHPHHPVLDHNYGNLLMEKGDFAGALNRFEAATSVNPHQADSFVNAGNCCFRLERLDEAVNHFERALGIEDESFEAWANLAETKRRLGDRAGALDAYDRAIALRPGDSRLRQRAAELR